MGKNTKNKPFCPVEVTLNVVSGKWKIVIIHYLINGPKRFNELQKLLGGISHRTLIQQLREMEECGLISRKDYKTIPPKVDYRLTKLGNSLSPVLSAMHEWGRQHPKAGE